MEPKLIITIGISGSGKSTFASTTVQHNPERYVNVERDKIRNLLFGYTDETISEYYNRPDLNKLEKEVTRYEDLMIKEGLSQNKTVIVSNTHLSMKYLEKYKFYNVETELMFFDIDFDEALVRDKNRTRTVGKKVIEKQFSKYNNLKINLVKNPIDFTTVHIELNKELPKILILDLDGTIAHMKNRSPFDWKRVGEDSVDKNILEILDCLNFSNIRCRELNFDTTEIIVCTGRDGSCEKESKEWCSKYGIEYKEFHMRPEGDYRPDWQVKEEMWRDIAERYNIVTLIDDRDVVVQRGRYLGLKVLQVEYHNF